MHKGIGNILLILLLFLPVSAVATTEYARQTGLSCGSCHLEEAGGGPLNREGERFLKSLETKGVRTPLTTFQRIVRFMIGYVHLFFAIAWFGTILYVHIILKPAYAAGGLPRGELLMGWVSIIVMAVTGTLLTIARIPSWEALFTTRFGILLSIKISLFLIMALTAFMVTFFIGPRLRRKRKAMKDLQTGEFTLDELAAFDGREGRPAYFACKGIVYDATQSRLWKEGSHMRKHSAGADLSDALKMAPHDEEKLLSIPQAGRLVAEKGEVAGKPPHLKFFYLFAYLNLAFVFLIIFIIALWRWW
ncbi:MAG: CopD family protein [Thermodesulfovibrionales bacterium]|jgi:predicted heme/steroid binding protein/uncharacterized membrane protein